MKALKSELAKSLLADPVAAKKLQEWLVTGRNPATEISFTYSYKRHEVEVKRVTPMIVPKAG